MSNKIQSNKISEIKKKVILMDLDGVLCKGESWSSKQCLKVKPILENIRKNNLLFSNNVIIIYTARRDENIPATLEWLRRNNVRYHAISNIKTSADLYIDDKGRRIEELK